MCVFHTKCAFSYGITTCFERTENGLDFLRALQLGSFDRPEIQPPKGRVLNKFSTQETMSNNEIPFTRPIAKNLPSLDRRRLFFFLVLAVDGWDGIETCSLGMLDIFFGVRGNFCEVQKRTHKPESWTFSHFTDSKILTTSMFFFNHVENRNPLETSNAQQGDFKNASPREVPHRKDCRLKKIAHGASTGL